MRLPFLSSKDAARVKQLLAVQQPCVLCRAPEAPIAALFVPDKPEIWGGSKGTSQACAYRLCLACLALPDAERSLRIEGKLAAGVVGRRN